MQCDAMQMDAKHQIKHMKLMSNRFACCVRCVMCMMTRLYFSFVGNVYGVDLGNVFQLISNRKYIFSACLFLSPFSSRSSDFPAMISILSLRCSWFSRWKKE